MSENRMRGLGLGGVVKCWDCQSSVEGQHRPECEKAPKKGILSSWSTASQTAMGYSNYLKSRAAAKEFLDEKPYFCQVCCSCVPGFHSESCTANQRDGGVPSSYSPTKPIDKVTERKMTPLWSGLVKYFPDALIAVARLSQVANDQHNPGEPLHWARGKSMDQEDCLLRHLWDAGSVDTDGQRHTAKVAWRALAMLQLELEKDGGKIL